MAKLQILEDCNKFWQAIASLMSKKKIEQQKCSNYHCNFTFTGTVFYISYISLYCKKLRGFASHWDKTEEVFWSFLCIETFSPIETVCSIDTTEANEDNVSLLKVKILFLKGHEKKSFQMFTPSINKSHALAKSCLGGFLAPLRAVAKLIMTSSRNNINQNVPQEGDSLEVQLYQTKNITQKD